MVQSVTRATPTPALPLRRGGGVACWDIFCRVIDNYGDIGVCWRLATQLAGRHGISVRLWLDDLGSLQALCPQVDPDANQQVVQDVEIHPWRADFPAVTPAGVVIEAFACELPPSYLAAMAAQSVKPLWINLEYLTAEPWTEGCHGMASPHSQLPLTKYFYFPGFTERTGGLLPAADFSPAATGLASRLGLSVPQPDTLCVSLFGYENAGVGALLQAFAQGDFPVTCWLPVGKLLPQVAAWLGERELQAHQVVRRGKLTLRVLPFMPQPDYDALLWLCDVNFVRGEDSFVRAQWAARPFVWHIYPQPDDAHQPKLDAFLSLYTQQLPSPVAADLTAFWQAWNEKPGTRMAESDWARLWQHRDLLRLHAQRWAASLAQNKDLVTGLVDFCVAKQNKNGL